ncbi:MAG: HAMP domain-containing histidine kinase [Lachnospiraceae bacterium]|nr:HAMP domain-containing histidine kinase [Lachnospiraceae bacterium]
MDKIRALRKYIIKNFFLILGIVFAVETTILLVLNNLVFPRIGDFIFRGSNIGRYDVLTLLAFILYFVLRSFMLFISRFVPITVGNLDDRLIDSINIFEGNVLIDNYESLNFLIKLLIILVLIMAVVLILTPLLAAGVVFTGIVIAKFRKLEQEEEEKKKYFDRRRNLMLSDIAHDLRTPITTIYGYSQAILEGKGKPEERDEYLKLICMKSKKVDELIGLLFDYVKIDSEGFGLHKETTDLAETLRQSGAFLYQDVTDAGMELEAEIPEEVLNISADRVQLSRVINNLITNAIKHNPEGTRIGLYLEGTPGSWVLDIADSGPEIESVIAEKLFEPFATGDESRVSKGGSGLGLSIAKKVAEMHGFKLELYQGDRIGGRLKKDGYTKTFRMSGGN